MPLQETSQNQTGSGTSDLKENQSSQNEARSRVSSVGFTEGNNNTGKDRKPGRYRVLQKIIMLV